MAPRESQKYAGFSTPKNPDSPQFLGSGRSPLGIDSQLRFPERFARRQRDRPGPAGTRFDPDYTGIEINLDAIGLDGHCHNDRADDGLSAADLVQPTGKQMRLGEQGAKLGGFLDPRQAP